MENTNETLNKSDKSALHNVLRLCVRLRSVGIERSGSLHKTAVLVAQLKYTKNLYKNWIFRKFMYARKEEFYSPIICFG